MLKLAELTPLNKTNDPLDKVNYMPVSVLPCVWTMFERIFVEQLAEFFESVLPQYL